MIEKQEEAYNEWLLLWGYRVVRWFDTDPNLVQVLTSIDALWSTRMPCEHGWGNESGYILKTPEELDPEFIL